MPFSNSCKRQNPELSTPQESNPSQFVSKRRKCSHPSGSEPPAFWDNLSKVHLTKRALKELNRRNAETQKSRQPVPRLRRPITRRFLTHLECSQPLTPAVSYLRHCSTRILKNIKNSARHGGPDLSDLRGLPEPLSPPGKVMRLSSSSSRPNRSSTPTTRRSTNTTKIKSTSPYDRNFQQNLDHLTDGTLAPGNPDIYYGSRPEELDRQVRDELNGHIVPSTQGNLPIAPNFFLAVKGPDGSPGVAIRQACYDGALGARGMHALQSYGQDGGVSGNSASTITSTYQLGQLMMFISHRVQKSGPESRTEYFTHQLGGWSMTSDPETFRRGATAYRNARDWAKEQRDNAIRRANESACQVKPPDTETEQISNRIRETTMDELTQNSQHLRNETSDTTTDIQPESFDENTSRPAKVSNRLLLQASPPQRQRHTP